MSRRKKKFTSILPEHCFWIYRGPIVSDLKELRGALRGDVTNEQFKHHVTKEKNDFAHWTLDTLKDKSCSVVLKKTCTKKGTIRALTECLSKYK